MTWTILTLVPGFKLCARRVSVESFSGKIETSGSDRLSLANVLTLLSSPL